MYILANFDGSVAHISGLRYDEDGCMATVYRWNRMRNDEVSHIGKKTGVTMEKVKCRRKHSVLLR